MQRISAIIIAYNEEHNIERCLASVQPFTDEIIVVDSHSTDATLEIARRFTDKVHTRDWPGYGAQKQWALERASNDWVFSIDADEEVSDELRREITALDFSHDGYYMPRKVWYLNRWILHSGWYPNFVLRLFRRSEAAFTADILHEKVVVEGKVARLTHPLHHYTYRNISHHLEKMNQFTTLAASKMYEQGQRAGLHSVTVVPVFGFLKMYVARRGFLDGLPGLVIATLHALYVFLKYAKLIEMSLSVKWHGSATTTRHRPPASVAASRDDQHH